MFQSEREPGNPFYQIYRTNLETGVTRRRDDLRIAGPRLPEL